MHGMSTDEELDYWRERARKAEQNLADALRSAEDFNAQRVEVGRAYRRVLDERDAANRELERWRHGNMIEGDFVCPDSLALTEARAECEALSKTITECNWQLVRAEQQLATARDALKEKQWESALAVLDKLIGGSR